jgi:hypothetical protein
MNNENALNMRLRVTKAKTFQKTELLWQRALNMLRAGRQSAARRSALWKKYAGIYLKPLQRQVGLQKGAATVDTAISDFLADSQHIVDRLPIVYQRLYRIAPLDEAGLFVGRTIETKALKKALASWSDGRFSPIVIIGERWSGITTLINNFLRQELSGEKVIYFKPGRMLNGRQDFFLFWEETLNLPALKDTATLINHLNADDKKQIIVVEHLQNLYTRSIHGFEGLKLLFEVISGTYKQNFWICACTLYAWDYLDKTIEIGGYFGYVSRLKPLTNEEIKDVVIRRNNISGYRLTFEASAKDKGSRKFQRLSAEEKQQFLKEEFFKEINAFARGNVSLALMYWLLSIKSIGEEGIVIRKFKSPDFSFMSNLSQQKVFLLHMLLLHDGLGADMISGLSHVPTAETNLLLMVMQDDGILVKKDDLYLINPLLYRSAINLLTAKNLIH